MSKSIAIVEDDPILRKALSIKLSSMGYDIQESEDGQVFLDSLGDSKPDIVLLDIMMPNKDGFETLVELKEKKEYKETPVLMLSNLERDENRKKGMSLGAVGYIVKVNANFDAIIESIEKYL